MKLLDLLLGRKLANREGESEKITALQGVPAMGLDGLASSAYGPEAALTILAPLGFVGLAYMGPITIAVLAVLAILYVSYWQTIEAYPTSGGSYTVARENLGANAGLLAATALMIDYVLNVAVGISAGVGALTSAVPMLHPYTRWLCLGILVLVTLINLRGTFEAGLVFAVPTYLFVLTFGGGVVVYGVWQALMAGGDPVPVAPPPAAPAEIGAAVSVPLPSGSTRLVPPARLRDPGAAAGQFGRHPVARRNSRHPARNLRRHHRPADPVICGRRLSVLHLVSGRNGGALVAPALPER